MSQRKAESEKKVRSSICWHPKYLKFMQQEANRFTNGSVSHMIEVLVKERMDGSFSASIK